MGVKWMMSIGNICKKGESMVGFLFTLIVLIVCVTCLIAMYIYYCSENKTGLFLNMTRYYEKKIDSLEKRVEKLEKNQSTWKVKEKALSNQNHYQ